MRKFLVGLLICAAAPALSKEPAWKSAPVIGWADDARCPSFSSDMNFDGLYTISDLWMQVKWLFTLPANLILNFVMSDAKWRTFWEVTPDNCSGVGAAVASLFIWTVAFSLLSSGR